MKHLRPFLAALLILLTVDVASGQSYRTIMERYPDAYRAFALRTITSHAEPDVSSPVRDTISARAGMLVYAQQGNMLAVALATRGAIGWVNRDDVMIPPGANAAATVEQPTMPAPLVVQRTATDEAALRELRSIKAAVWTLAGIQIAGIIASVLLISTL